MLTKISDKAFIAVVCIAFVALIVGSVPAAPVTYIYDELNRLKEVRYPDDTVIKYDYDKLGNRTYMETSGNPHLFITAAAGTNGTISPQGTVTVNYGASQAFSITPTTGYHIEDVRVDGASQGAINSYTFDNITAVHMVEANFAINTYIITATAGNGGTIDPTTASVNYGGSQTCAIAPNAGYQIEDVKVDGVSQGAITSYKFNNVSANHTITASFKTSAVLTIMATSGINGTISPSGAVSVYTGANQTFTMTPSTSTYQVGIVKVDGMIVGGMTSYTFNNVTANHSIEVVFTKKHFMDLFNMLYGTALYNRAMKNGGVCTICHNTHSTSLYNGYGNDILKERNKGLPEYESLKNVELLDSDGDGFNNVTEINSVKFPGIASDHP